MDRDAIARRQRRRQIEEACAEEHERELALSERLEEVVTERLGPEIDAAAFERMEPEEAEVVREALVTPPFFEDDELEDASADLATEPAGEPETDAETEAEIVRLQGEIEESRRRQLAYRRYLDALGS